MILLVNRARECTGTCTQHTRIQAYIYSHAYSVWCGYGRNMLTSSKRGLWQYPQCNCRRWCLGPRVHTLEEEKAPQNEDLIKTVKSCHVLGHVWLCVCVCAHVYVYVYAYVYVCVRVCVCCMPYSSELQSVVGNCVVYWVCASVRSYHPQLGS